MSFCIKMTKNALISVFNKNNIVDLAKYLIANDYNILSTVVQQNVETIIFLLQIYLIIHLT